MVRVGRDGYHLEFGKHQGGQAAAAHAAGVDRVEPTLPDERFTRTQVIVMPDDQRLRL